MGKLRTNPNDSAMPEISTDAKHAKTSTGDTIPYGEVYSYGGLSKRELFAAMAMQGMSQNVYSTLDLEIYPKRAVKIADALIQALNKPQEKKDAETV